VANERFAQLAGASIDYLTGHLLRDVLPQWPAFGFEDECRAVMGMAHGHQRDVELEIGGSTRWFSAFIGPLMDGCVVRLADITVVKQNEAALRANTLRLQSDNAQLRQLAWLDGLTGLSNRRALDVILEREMARARRNNTPLTLAMCDIDHFKAYNDFYGHLAGDDCIREVAQVLAETGARAADLVARYGGEEFVLVMPDTTLEGGMEVVRRAQQALHDRALPDATSPKDKLLTLSFGLAQFEPSKDEDGVTLLGRADTALYRAKHQGRNRIATQEIA
jgi:diguanylate cyclase (GGDEF)-like protein